MLDMLQYALDRNWYLFPARWENGHKPLIKWRSESSNIPQTIQAWRDRWPECYLCVDLARSGLTILDVDVKKDAGGLKSLLSLEIMNGALPTTLKACTPSGGQHFYFTGAAKNSIGKLGPGLDVPVMVPLAGQTVPGKGEYIVTKNAPVAPTPDWIISASGAWREVSQDIAPGVEEDIPQNIVAAMSAISSQTAPAPRGTRNQWAYKAACIVRDYAISPETCELILSPVNDKICTPPLSYAELSATIAHAYEYARSAAGSALPEADFDPVYPNEPSTADDFSAAPAQPAAPAGVLHLDDLTGPAPERQWIIQDWLPEGELTALYGPPGSGKSMAALQLALAVASGTKWLNMPAKQMPVLTVACEDSADELHRRLASCKGDATYSFALDDPETRKNWYGWPRVGADNILAQSDPRTGKVVPGPFWPELRAQLSWMPKGPKLVVLDTIADIFAGSENDRPAVNSFLKTCLGRLRIDYEATVLIVGHPAKSDSSQYSGSTAWDGGVRSRWYMGKYESNDRLSDHRVLSRTKSNYASTSAAGGRLVLQWVNGTFIPVIETEIIDPELNENCQLVYAAIAKEAESGSGLLNNHTLSPKNLYNWPTLRNTYGVKMPRVVIDECLGRLIADGLIEKTQLNHRNGYQPTFIGHSEQIYLNIDRTIKHEAENRNK
jgi:hypothetical protein